LYIIVKGRSYKVQVSSLFSQSCPTLEVISLTLRATMCKNSDMDGRTMLRIFQNNLLKTPQTHSTYFVQLCMYSRLFKAMNIRDSPSSQPRDTSGRPDYEPPWYKHVHINWK